MYIPKPNLKLRPLPDWFKRLEVHCTGNLKPGHWSVRTKFVGFAPSTKFSLRVPSQMGAIYICPACHARELIGADFHTGKPRRLASI